MKYFIGIDPSFKGMGISVIDIDKKEITFKEMSVELGNGTFAEVSKASINMVGQVKDYLSNYDDCIIGMEIPPVQGMYAVKLWALDTHVYNALDTKPYLFNVPYLKFINKKYDGKKDTINMINNIVKVFEDNDYKIIQTVVDKKGKPKKLTSNECDSFIYAIRMFVKRHYDNGITDEMLAEIVNINDKFLEEKETLLGKKL